MTQECVDYTLFSIGLKILYIVPCCGSHYQLKQKTFKQRLYPPRSSHTQAMEPSVKLDKMGDVSALCVVDGGDVPGLSLPKRLCGGCGL